MTTLTSRYIKVVKQWLADNDSVSRVQLTQNAAHADRTYAYAYAVSSAADAGAYDDAAAYAADAAAHDAAHAAAYAADVAAEAADDARYWVERYKELTK